MYFVLPTLSRKYLRYIFFKITANKTCVKIYMSTLILVPTKTTFSNTFNQTTKDYFKLEKEVSRIICSILNKAGHTCAEVSLKEAMCHNTLRAVRIDRSLPPGFANKQRLAISRSNSWKMIGHTSLCDEWTQRGRMQLPSSFFCRCWTSTSLSKVGQNWKQKDPIALKMI